MGSLARLEWNENSQWDHWPGIYGFTAANGITSQARNDLIASTGVPCTRCKYRPWLASTSAQWSQTQWLNQSDPQQIEPMDSRYGDHCLHRLNWPAANGRIGHTEMYWDHRSAGPNWSHGKPILSHWPGLKGLWSSSPMSPRVWFTRLWCASSALKRACYSCKKVLAKKQYLFSKKQRQHCINIGLHLFDYRYCLITWLPKSRHASWPPDSGANS